MITQIHYKNFKALQDTTLPLGRFTLIVGANGTGKTTAMQALKYAQRKQPDDFKRILSANVKTPLGGEVEVRFFWKSSESINEYAVNWDDLFGETVSLTERYVVNGISYSKLDEIPTQVRLRKSVEAPKNALEEFSIFTFESERISQAVQVKGEAKLESHAGNLAGVLDHLRDTEPEKFEELNVELKKWFPEYDRILFETPDNGRKAILLRTKVGRHKIKAADLSHGTLLGLAYLTVAYLPNPPKLVCFEEPEHGIHPRLLRNIQESLDRLAYPEKFGEKRQPVQVIATTHSPYLLDLYKDRREEIVIADKDETGVHFNRLIDLPHIEEILKEQDAPLGDIWFSGVLGGVPA
ncbi:MAG TPA: AAA family ATPase [Pyrinomonadaceae bacterium]|jgi:predicted ATPase